MICRSWPSPGEERRDGDEDFPQMYLKTVIAASGTVPFSYTVSVYCCCRRFLYNQQPDRRSLYPDRGPVLPVRSGTGSCDVEHDPGRCIIMPDAKGRAMDHSTDRLSEAVCEEHNYVDG